MRELTVEKARSIVKESEDTIESLINPSDLIHQDIDSWDNVNVDSLRDELADSLTEAWTYGINHPYGDLIHELAVNLYVEDMVRVPFDHLVFNSRAKCVIEGYWLYDMGKCEVRELVSENSEGIEWFHECEFEAMMEIESAILEARLENFE